MDKGLVSCVIPTYKRSATLLRAVKSVLNQTYQNIEVLVVDDNEKGSQESADVAKAINQIEDKRVRLILQEKHINGAEARNAGIRASEGEYIAFLDDDDEWLPTKIEKQVAILQEHQEIGGVSCLYNEYSNGVLFHSCPPYTSDNLHKKVFQRSVAVFTSTILLRKTALLDAGVFDTNLKRHQDLQLLLDFTGRYDIYAINEYLVNLHSDSAINRPSYEKLITIKEDFFKAVEKHFERYSMRERKIILSAHYYELAFSALKEKKYFAAMKQFLRAGFRLESLALLKKRMQDRKFKVKNA